MGKILAVACTVVSVLFGLSSVYYAVTRPFATRYYNETWPVWLPIPLFLSSIVSLFVAWWLWRIDEE